MQSHEQTLRKKKFLHLPPSAQTKRALINFTSWNKIPPTRALPQNPAAYACVPAQNHFPVTPPPARPCSGTGEQSSPFLNGPQLKQVQKCEACKLRKNSAPAAHHGRMIQEAKLCLIKSENFLQMNFSRIMPSLALQYYTQACSRSLTGTYFVVNLHKGLCERAQACHTHVI